MDEILKLREELERERMRLAACGVVALANTPDSAEKARTMHDDYRSASCDDVARAVDRQMALHNALTAVMSYPGVRDYLGGQVSEIADSALMGPNVEVTGLAAASLPQGPCGLPGSATGSAED